MRIARAIGWQGDLPAPFAVKSARRFDVPCETIALHPGCKPNWPWKKWHGFDELAALLPSVAVIGTPSDLDNTGTYFARPFRWPDHVHDFVGQLDLRDTAALISQCAALISIDSGMMHLGVALRVPTFGIFGITSPQRECIPSPNMIPISKKLVCEPMCRRRPWGRRDCEHHLAVPQVPDRARGRGSRRRVASMKSDALTVTYYGEVFSTSGYGTAARAYVHALHAAGVRIAIFAAGRPPQQFEDDLVLSLVRREPSPDIIIVHAIPSFWPRWAYTAHNVVAITVWEADPIPRAWERALNRAIDVWVPCAFNVIAFGKALGTPPFCLPYALPAYSAASSRRCSLPGS